MTPARGSAGAWLLAARLKTLPAALAPVALGAAVAKHAGGFDALAALLAALGALWIQIGTNFANDVFDYEKGADTEHRLGPTRAVQAGLLSPKAMRVGMVIAFALAAACGVGLAILGGLPVVIIGVASILAGIAYTGGPYPLGYHGLGDPFVFVFFGPVAVLGTVWVQMRAIPDLAWWMAVPAGALATAILVVNNLRDADTDALAGKRTLAVRLGKRGARLEYTALLTLAFALPLYLAVHGLPWLALSLLALPLAVSLCRTIWRPQDGATLNRALARTALLLLVHSALISLALACGGS